MQTLMELLVITSVVALVVVVMALLLLRRAVRRLRRGVGAWLTGLTGLARLAGGQWPFLPTERMSDQGSGMRSPRVSLGPSAAVTTWPLLWARARLPGTGREVALVRRELLRDMTGTTRVVSAGLRAGRPLERLERDVAELAEQARALDVNLQVIAAEPDGATRRELLAVHAARADLIRQTCTRVRAAVLIGGSSADDAVLNRIVDDINDQVSAVDLQARAYRELSNLHG